MKRAQRILSLLGMAFATVAMAGVASADQQPTQKVAEKLSTTATVEKVDANKRELSLKDDQGNNLMVQVPEGVTRFDAIKKGDKIDLDYYQSVALSLKKPGQAPSVSETTIAGRPAGNQPGATIGRKITASVEVMKVDPAQNKVTVKGPSGAMDTINVSDPGMQAKLGMLKKGDRIQASYTEALAASVMPKQKEQ